jgi:protein-export membrane protein SecD
MEKAWYWKVALVLLLVVGSVLYLLPTFLPNSLPGWYTDIFEKRVNLGLDLQGGIHLVLGVEVEKALEDKADQYARDFKAAMKEKRISYRRVFRVPGTWQIQFELKDAEDKARLEKRILEGFQNLEQVDVDEDQDGKVVRVSFKAEYVEELRRNARDQARITVRNRVDEFGVADPTIAPHGETGILVQLPGMFDPERAKSLLGRTAQLEFKMVDDESDFIRSLQDELPEGVRMETYTYEGPDDTPVTEYFLIARGEGNEGRNKLLDFFNNAKEIEAFLNEQDVPAEMIDEVMKKVSGGLSPLERREILELVGPVLAGGKAKAAAAKEAGEGKLAEEEAAAEKGSEVGAAEQQVAAEKAAEEQVAADESDEQDEEHAETAAAQLPRSRELMRLEKLLAGKVPAGHTIAFGRTERQLEVEFRTYYLFSEVAMTGDYITDARVTNDPDTGAPEVSLDFDRTGGNIFERLTGENVRKRMAIVLEGEVASAPVIQTRIGGGRARITLGATQNYNEALSEAQDLAVVLRAGALPAPVRILEERTVGPTMGEDARRQGTYALILGLALVIVFMVIYYRLSGVVADLALILNALFIMTVMAAFEATLTLPGIAGIILTIGMAVDANVIINERIREEMHSGKTPRAAVEAGYSRAFWTIFDANFTTLIAAVVLWSYGSGPIQGFAVTLFIGILASMFTAIFITRLVVDWLVLKKKVQRLSI